jgi:hypothetical protein
MNTSTNNQLFTSIVARTIAQVAPHEMRLFQGQQDAYLQNPEQIIHKRGYDNPTSPTEKILFLAPIIHSILNEVLKMLEPKWVDGEETQGQLTLPRHALSSGKAKEIYDFAYQEACQSHLSRIKSHLVADAVLENLAPGLTRT